MIRVSDHAVLRWLERAGGLDVEAVRRALAASVARAVVAAEAIDGRDYQIVTDDLTFVVRNRTVVTVLPPRDLRR